MKHIGLPILATVLLAAGTARADTITIVLDSPTLSGSTGSVLHFFGTLTNTTGDIVYLNGDNFNTALPDPSAIDGTPFFNNTPLYLAANGTTGDTTGDVELFNVTILPSFTGSYDNTFLVQGGAGPDSQDTLSSADFTVQVVPAQPGSGVPEPATLPLLAAGAGALLVCRRVRLGIGRRGAR